MERSYGPALVLRESFIASGIWMLVVAFLLVGASVAQVRGFANFYQQTNIAGFLGSLIGQFVLLALLIAVYGTWRLRRGVTRSSWRIGGFGASA